MKYFPQPIFYAPIILLCIGSGSIQAAEPKPVFYRGVNLNGPPVTIDGHAWEGQDDKNSTRDFICKDKAFANQEVPLLPATDAERAKMIRSSCWGGNEVQITAVPAGRYSVFL